MNINGIKYLIASNGYLLMESNVPFIRFYCKKIDDSEIMYVLGCVDNVAKDKFSAEQLDNIAFQVERKFLLSGMSKVNILFMIYSDNFDRDKKFCEGNSNFWIIDTLTDRVIVFENQPEDFDGLRDKLEIMLNSIRVKEISNTKTKSQFKQWPWITMIFMLLNIAYFFILEYLGSTDNVLFMLKYGAAYHVNIFKNHEYYRLITCMFMHFGFAHLLNNMIALALLGNETEKFYGKIKFTAIYMISGILGSLASALYYQYTNGVVVSAGASGAIYGIMGALVVKVVEDRRKKMSSFGRIIFFIIMIMLAGRGSGNVDNIAHIGGFLSGMICGIVSYMWMCRKKLC